jgi:hypothetical protein
VLSGLANTDGCGVSQGDLSRRVYEIVVGKQGKKEYPHLDKKTINQRGDSRMETNEQIRRVLKQALEEELAQFLEQVSQMTEGDLKHLEEQVVKSSQAIGRKLMAGVLTSRLHERRPVARRQGSCGHVQRLVGERSKELITLVGPVSFVRPYYQCLQTAEPPEEHDCHHAEAPADALWGVDQQRTTPGVQQQIS